MIRISLGMINDIRYPLYRFSKEDMEDKDLLKELKYCLYQLIDAKMLYHETQSVELRCQNYEFYSRVCSLSFEEQKYLMAKIVFLVDCILPLKDIFLAKLRRYIEFRYDPHANFYAWSLSFRGYETECQEFYCLIQIFNQVPFCGYSKYLDVFYIETDQERLFP